MKKDLSIQNLKALMLLGVVVNHAWAAHQYIITPQIPHCVVFSWFSNCLACSGLPVFFFLSGYFAGKRIDDVLSLQGYVSFMKKKTHQLLIPYMSWNLLFILFFLSMGFVFPRLEQRVEQKQLTTICGFLTSWLGIGTRPIDAPLWFVRDLFLIFVGFPFVALTVKRIPWFWLVSLVAMLTIPPLKQIFGAWNWYSILCVAAGSWAAHRKIDLHCFEKWRFVLPLVWIAYSIVHFGMWQRSGRYSPNDYSSIVFIVVSIGAWLGFLKWVDFDAKSFFVRYITASSFFLYCSHFLVCSCCLHVVAGRIPNMPYKLLCLYAVFMGIGVPLIIVWYSFSKRLTPRLAGVLSGGRVI